MLSSVDAVEAMHHLLQVEETGADRGVVEWKIEDLRALRFAQLVYSDSGYGKRLLRRR